MNENLKCPVCGEFKFDEWNDLDLCEVCAWRNDVLYLGEPDKRVGGAIKISLNEYREAYKNGQLWWQLEGKKEPFDRVSKED